MGEEEKIVKYETIGHFHPIWAYLQQTFQKSELYLKKKTNNIFVLFGFLIDSFVTEIIRFFM